MRKLVLILVALIALATFIRAFTVDTKADLTDHAAHGLDIAEGLNS